MSLHLKEFGPFYQEIAARALHLKEFGLNTSTIAHRFSVGRKTVVKAVECIGPLVHCYASIIYWSALQTTLPQCQRIIDQSKFTVIVNGKQLNPELGWIMNLLFNMLSRCPVIWKKHTCWKKARQSPDRNSIGRAEL